MLVLSRLGIRTASIAVAAGSTHTVTAIAAEAATAPVSVAIPKIVARPNATATATATPQNRLIGKSSANLQSRFISTSIPSSFSSSSISSSSSSHPAASSASSSSSSSQSIFAPHDTFARRHLGPSDAADVKTMLTTIGYKTLDDLIRHTVPNLIRSPSPLSGEPQGETEALNEFQTLMAENQLFRSHIGLGYYDTITPPVILRNILENPAWYTPYTPYQAEIAQGRLEMLLNFQTMVGDLTAMPVANSSLLDEATAGAEAMNMCFGMGTKKKRLFLVADHTHPQTIAVIQTRAAGIGVQVKVVPAATFAQHYASGEVFAVLIQYPDTYGSIADHSALCAEARQNDVRVVVAADLLSLTVLTPPGEWGADVVFGSAQRFGVPMGFGGPHAAFLATTDAYKRKLPGRIIGVSRDSRGKPALRMAMQTREQHIRRDKATSNICTAQALLANTAAAYGIYHGPKGLKQIAEKCHAGARTLAVAIQEIGLQLKSSHFFDTVHIQVPSGTADRFHAAAETRHINLRRIDGESLSVSFDETTTAQVVDDLIQVFAEGQGVKYGKKAEEIVKGLDLSLSAPFARKSEYLSHPVFHMYHSETEMLRYLYRLSSKDLSLATAMIPLGSCTMKLNATSEMIPITLPTVNALHPFAPSSQTRGYGKMLTKLKDQLAEITGFDAVSLQPNAGSQGEYAGLLAIANYHAHRGETHRTICLIPTSAHGTNPASAVMAAMKVVVVACDSKGEIDMEDLKAKAEKHAANLSCLMVTYPSTHGVFEENIKNVCDIIHNNGGQVYMDGANMNAQVGLTSPGFIGADVCHLNLHKTFCIPHGGGGPGMGPIGVKKHLAPFLPSHPFQPPFIAERITGPVSAAPFSSASILPISYMYIKMMGGRGLTLATKTAILNANYMAARLKKFYTILYTGTHGACAHEFIIDLREFKTTANVTEEDVAKRLMDFNFHAPTMSWPVVGTLMVEPTESESVYELDRFCDAMIAIRKEIEEIASGKADPKVNVLKNAPHTADMVLSDSWDFPYAREKAAFPLSYLRTQKFWPSVGRLDNVYGDRHVVCTCPPLEAYQDGEEGKK